MMMMEMEMEFNNPYLQPLFLIILIPKYMYLK